jgi:prepilin-type N-terminal cleavage/methylation domain-containing protein
MEIWRARRGFGLVEILIVLIAVAIASAVLYKYIASTARTVETLQEQRAMGGARLAADQAALGTIRTAVQTYYARQGQWPADKAAVLAVLDAPPRFQCAGNDFEYEPAGGQVRLRIDDPARC